MNNKSGKIIEAGSHVLVVGLGKTGLSAVTFLQGLGVHVSVSESQPLAKLDPGMVSALSRQDVFLEAGGHSEKLFTSVDRIMVSPGIPLTIPALVAARKQGITIFGDMALTPYFLQAPMAAITGTNGKSTVTTLLGDLLLASGKNPFVGGNIGTPLTDFFMSSQDAESVVLEVSSYQLDTSGDFRPDVAVLLNITPDHLDRYESYDAYADSKFRIFAKQSRQDAAVLNLDDAEIMARLPARFNARTFFFGTDLGGRPGATIRDGKVLLNLQQGTADEIYDLADTALSLPPNTQNAMAAIIAARLMGCRADKVVAGLHSFRPLAHRIDLIAEIDGIRFYDDSKATNVGAVYAALSAMERPVVLIAGGREKGSDYRLIHELVRRKVKAVVVIGEARARMLAEFGPLTRVSSAGSMVEAVGMAKELADAGDDVLLSPACASFDMFNSYAHRGDVFAQAVLGLTNRTAAPINN
ncbi:MAG: UDP-N-acetylmuramoylalanine--D-glutamate ligase [Deltaproteobacteria bacterium RIFOXYD12_FULL_50_9]|nr:MAG: UDP-N-acetylmuramoylalanine--D-glutamate ligase [Deltaproteobacteria bacterium RIFOXYD12_FULL_50_9]